jgi:hypothetical protein
LAGFLAVLFLAPAFAFFAIGNPPFGPAVRVERSASAVNDVGVARGHPRWPARDYRFFAGFFAAVFFAGLAAFFAILPPLRVVLSP